MYGSNMNYFGHLINDETFSSTTSGKTEINQAIVNAEVSSFKREFFYLKIYNFAARSFLPMLMNTQ